MEAWRGSGKVATAGGTDIAKENPRGFPFSSDHEKLLAVNALGKIRPSEGDYGSIFGPLFSFMPKRAGRIFELCRRQTVTSFLEIFIT